MCAVGKSTIVTLIMILTKMHVVSKKNLDQEKWYGIAKKKNVSGYSMPMSATLSQTVKLLYIQRQFPKLRLHTQMNAVRWAIQAIPITWKPVANKLLKPK